MSHDPAKRRKNLRKHGIDLPGCMEAFDGPVLTREDDREDYGATIGELGLGAWPSGCACVDRPRRRTPTDFVP